MIVIDCPEREIRRFAIPRWPYLRNAIAVQVLGND